MIKTVDFNTHIFHNLSPPNRRSFGILFGAAIFGHVVFGSAILFVAGVEEVARVGTPQFVFLGKLSNMEAGAGQIVVGVFTNVDFTQFAVLLVDQEDVAVVARAFRWFRFLQNEGY